MKIRLFERLCQKELLVEAWAAVKSKNSSGGIDGMSIKDFDDKSDKFLAEVLKELKSGKWTPYPYMEGSSQIELKRSTSTIWTKHRSACAISALTGTNPASYLQVLPVGCEVQAARALSALKSVLLCALRFSVRLQSGIDKAKNHPDKSKKDVNFFGLNKNF